ncbi:MAG: NAD(P)-dependent glycerol-3-phosphate dehydrogenase [Victivallales bacterium]|nr:NAD(P)-dependent glycerol-3-phosphate dehydrogenase [Victivallales bacterium]
MKNKFEAAVLSDGAWGTALALTLLDNGHCVKLWGPFPDYLGEIRETGENHRFLPGVRIPENLELLRDMGDAVADAEIVVLAAPVRYCRATLERFAPLAREGQLVLNVAKGIECGSLKRISELCEEILGRNVRYAVLSGPSHAEEVALKMPTAVVAASDDKSIAEKIQQAFMNKYFRVYTSSDVPGVELGGALKNVFAIAAGIVDGMGLGDNAKAALMTRGIAEMARMGVAMGGLSETFSGLSGIGDMIVTCTSGHSRNRRLGEALGKGRILPDILDDMGMVVAEGVGTTESGFHLSRSKALDTPIIDEMFAGLYNGKDPRECLRDLMGRKARREFD